MPDSLVCKAKESVIEAALAGAEALLTSDYPISRKSVAVLALENDADALSLIRDRQPEVIPLMENIRKKLESESSEPLEYAIALRHQKAAGDIASKAMKFKHEKDSDRWKPQCREKCPFSPSDGALRHGIQLSGDDC